MIAFFIRKRRHEIGFALLITIKYNLFMLISKDLVYYRPIVVNCTKFKRINLALVSSDKLNIFEDSSFFKCAIVYDYGNYYLQPYT